MGGMNRRHFLKTLGVASATALAFPALALRGQGRKRLRILHTNDTHSRLEPYPADDPNYPGMGGYARRASMIRSAREENENLLLLDAGDIFQGTPYYNLYNGEPELRLMSKMGYDAAAFGNHEFDNGLDGFAEVRHHATFPFLAANYDFSQTVLDGKVDAYKVLNKGGLTIGIYGLGIEFEGLVSRSLYGDTKYLDPIEKAREIESLLHNQYRCQLIICLSHLGYRYSDKKVSDRVIASHTSHTDIIIGGHTHSLLDPAVQTENQEGKLTTIGQAGYGGTYLGSMLVYYDEAEGEKFIESNTTKI